MDRPEAVNIGRMIVIEKEWASEARYFGKYVRRQRWSAIEARLEMPAPPYAVEATGQFEDGCPVGVQSA